MLCVSVGVHNTSGATDLPPISWRRMPGIVRGIYRKFHARRCRRLAERAFEVSRELLSPKIAHSIGEYIYKYNEWGVGVEMLVDTLLEFEIEVSAAQKQAIMKAMDAIGSDRSVSELRVDIHS